MHPSLTRGFISHAAELLHHTGGGSQGCESSVRHALYVHLLTLLLVSPIESSLCSYHHHVQAQAENDVKAARVYIGWKETEAYEITTHCRDEV